MAMSVAVAIVQSRLDYANSILYGTSAYNINKLQRVQNAAAHIVLGYPNTSSSDQLLELHWLPIYKRVHFKIASLTYKTLSTQQPIYLRSLLIPHQPGRALRSADLQLLSQPRSKLAIGERAFSAAAPKIWNRIPLAIRSAPSINSFKRQLKSYYFTSNVS
jgi:hypothetical protein